jgi:hypothetical protein
MFTVPARSSRMQREIARQSNVQTALESAYGGFLRRDRLGEGLARRRRAGQPDVPESARGGCG